MGLVELNRTLSARGRPLRELQDVLRGAVVLGLGSLDAMVADAIVQAVPSAARKAKLGKRVQGWVKGDPDAFLTLFARADPHRELAEMVREELALVTFQRTATIEDYLRAVLDVEVPWDDATNKAGVDGTAAAYRKELDLFVGRRNQIAHKGDVRSGAAPEGIHREWVETNLGRVSALGETICDAVNKAYGPRRGRPRPR